MFDVAHLADFKTEITSIFLISKALSFSSLTEWLARKTGAQDIVFWDCIQRDIIYVALNANAREVYLVQLLPLFKFPPIPLVLFPCTTSVFLWSTFLINDLHFWVYFWNSDLRQSHLILRS